MTPTIFLAAFTLITVTNQGEVFHAKGFDTLRMCEQAKSVAVYGRTIEQLEDDRKREDERQAKLDAEWRAKHPPRKATAKDGGEGSGCSGNGVVTICTRVKDGMFYEDRPSRFLSYTEFPPSDRISIKHAECVIEPPKP